MNPVPRHALLNPVAWLFGLAAIGLLFDLILVSTTGSPYTPGFYAFNSVVGYIAVCWLSRDSYRRKIYFPADIALLVFWIGFPAYLYEARGFKGLFLFVGAIVLYLAFVYLHLAFTDMVYLSQFD
ncbi:hypothetical protein IEN85_20440 [Pelagicoccus sp. NFK12]|uniref:Uncharacterized protein n=1 Tax=Pelagicoccus enzymogenes TaxID=2773457 RepID=A0A927FDP1_9BACT|nr:hypothetical protein [Pelagicoccus enzymogenes]MBD5781881.1 hypothetical protein [Pelagicoccus enzymogenes]MDQ8196638.1 hypothetical protein [Pelagicoccus enzymogenes]